MAMKFHVLFWTLATLMCTAILASDGEQEESSSNRFVQEMIVRAHHKLTTGLYRTFARKPGNLILSPWSVMTLLTVTYMVAGGRTANEIGDHLNINLLRRKEILAGFEHIHEAFQNIANESSSQVLESINGAVVGRRVHPSHRLQRLLRDNLGTYIHRVMRSRGRGKVPTPLDNRTSEVFPAGRSRGEKTPGQLDGLVPERKSLESRMSLWLFNWMSFQGQWRAPFDPSQTHIADFWVDGTEPVPVATMATKARFPRTQYAPLEMTLLELPYGQSDRHGLFILLPDRADGLPRLEKKLKGFNLESILSGNHWARMAKVFLPKFKFMTDVMLNGAMKKMGFRRMFSPKEADFSRLEPKQKRGKKSPYVQTMVHRAAIEVNENGTIASASTALRLTSRKYVHFFRVNHPFIFVLRDKTLGINLFIGRVIDPRELS